jgi:hypothetical protein
LLSKSSTTLRTTCRAVSFVASGIIRLSDNRVPTRWMSGSTAPRSSGSSRSCRRFSRLIASCWASAKPVPARKPSIHAAAAAGSVPGASARIRCSATAASSSWALDEPHGDWDSQLAHQIADPGTPAAALAAVTAAYGAVLDWM